MALAYKCDGCDAFQEGRPEAAIALPASMDVDTHDAELCETCQHRLEQFFAGELVPQTAAQEQDQRARLQDELDEVRDERDELLEERDGLELRIDRLEESLAEVQSDRDSLREIVDRVGPDDGDGEEQKDEDGRPEDTTVYMSSAHNSSGRKYHASEDCPRLANAVNVLEKDLAMLRGNFDPCEACHDVESDHADATETGEGGDDPDRVDPDDVPVLEDEDVPPSEVVAAWVTAHLDEHGSLEMTSTEIAERCDVDGRAVPHALNGLDGADVETREPDEANTGQVYVVTPTSENADDESADAASSTDGDDIVYTPSGRNHAPHYHEREDCVKLSNVRNLYEKSREDVEDRLDACEYCHVDGGTLVVSASQADQFGLGGSNGIVEPLRRVKGIEIEGKNDKGGETEYVLRRDRSVDASELGKIQSGDRSDWEPSEFDREDVEQAAENAQSVADLADRLGGISSERTLRLLGYYELDHLVTGGAPEVTAGGG